MWFVLWFSRLGPAFSVTWNALWQSYPILMFWFYTLLVVLLCIHWCHTPCFHSVNIMWLCMVSNTYSSWQVDGNTALGIAAEQNHERVVQLLLKANANLDIQCKVRPLSSIWCNARDKLYYSVCRCVFGCWHHQTLFTLVHPSSWWLWIVRYLHSRFTSKVSNSVCMFQIIVISDNR